MAKEKPLTKRQQDYIKHRIAGLSQHQAYLASHESSKKWKPNSVDKAAYKLEHNPKIRQPIHDGKKKAFEQSIEEGVVARQDIIRELARVGFANATDFVTVEEREGTNPLTNKPLKYKQVEIKTTEEIPEEKLAAIAAIKQGANGIEIKLYDKVKALVRLLDMDEGEDDFEDDGFLDALSAQVDDIWQDE